MSDRTRVWRRHQRERAIKNKIRKASHYFHYKHRGSLDKGKIHCSCYLCTHKTKFIGYSIRDQKALLSKSA